MITTLICLFFIGYLGIALEHPLKIDKTAIALLLGMLLWILYALGAEYIVPAVDGEGLKEYIAQNARMAGESLHTQSLNYILDVKIVEALGDITQTLFFLIGAMTIVELVDIHGGFTVITDHIRTNSKKKLLWIICLTTFVFSAVLDNMTTTIVMVLLLRKLVEDPKERWLYAGMVVIAANTGGAWSPIGDVTTIMLWVKGNVTALALIERVLLPSIVAMIVPLLIIAPQLKGELPPRKPDPAKAGEFISTRDRMLIFILGVGGLLFVPISRASPICLPSSGCSSCSAPSGSSPTSSITANESNAANSTVSPTLCRASTCPQSFSSSESLWPSRCSTLREYSKQPPCGSTTPSITSTSST